MHYYYYYSACRHGHDDPDVVAEGQRHQNGSLQRDIKKVFCKTFDSDVKTKLNKI